MESSTSSKHAMPTFHSTWIKVPSCERKAESSSAPLLHWRDHTDLGYLPYPHEIKLLQRLAVHLL